MKAAVFSLSLTVATALTGHRQPVTTTTSSTRRHSSLDMVPNPGTCSRGHAVVVCWEGDLLDLLSTLAQSIENAHDPHTGPSHVLFLQETIVGSAHRQRLKRFRLRPVPVPVSGAVAIAVVAMEDGGKRRLLAHPPWTRRCYVLCRNSKRD